VDYTFIQGLGWLKANPSALGSGLWVKTSEHGVILPKDEIPNLISALQDYMLSATE
jgi:hypothetical protein